MKRAAPSGGFSFSEAPRPLRRRADSGRLRSTETASSLADHRLLVRQKNRLERAVGLHQDVTIGIQAGVADGAMRIPTPADRPHRRPGEPEQFGLVVPDEIDLRDALKAITRLTQTTERTPKGENRRRRRPPRPNPQERRTRRSSQPTAPRRRRACRWSSFPRACLSIRVSSAAGKKGQRPKRGRFGLRSVVCSASRLTARRRSRRRSGWPRRRPTGG